MGSAAPAAALPYPGKATRIWRKGQRNTKEEKERKKEEEERKKERKKKNRTEVHLLANLTAYR